MTNRGETITMLDDEGLVHDFTLIDVVEVGDRRYAVLQPEKKDAAAVLFRLEGDRMAPVEDDAEFDRVVDVIRSLEEYDDLVIEDARAKRPLDDDDGRDEDDEDEDDTGEDDEDATDDDEEDDEEDDEDDDDEEDDDW